MNSFSFSMPKHYHQTVMTSNTVLGFHQMVKLGLNKGMEIQDVRRARLRILVNEMAGGSPTEFGKLVGKGQSYISDLLKNPEKSFGEKAARAIERKLKIEDRYLDRPLESKAEELSYPREIDREQSEWLRILGLLSPRQKQVIRSVISEFQLDRRHHSVPVETDHRTGADRREFIGKVIQAGPPLGRRVSKPNTNIHDFPEEPKKTSRLPEDEDAK